MTEQSLYITSFSKISGITDNGHGGGVLVLKSKPKKIKTGYIYVHPMPYLVETPRLLSSVMYRIKGVAAFTFNLHKAIESMERAGDCPVLIYEINGGFMLQGITGELEKTDIDVNWRYSYGSFDGEFTTQTKYAPLIVDSFEVATK
jgi:hypothetical protein